MNLDQSLYGYQEWHLPSPSSTPKSTTFSETLLQTPKVDSASTHFLDAYTTPQVNGHTTPAHTPLFPSSATFDQSLTYRGPAPDDPRFHVNHFSPNPHLPLPPVDPARRLSSSPGPLFVKHIAGEDARNESSLVQGPSLSTIMDPSFMQTPPPTRDSSRKKLAPAPGQNMKTPTTAVSRSASTPLTGISSSDGQFSQTPMQFPSLQLAMQFPSAGPASAPVYPQSRLFWDQPQSGPSGDVDMITDDPFGPTPQRSNEPFSWPFGSPNPQTSTQAANQASHTASALAANDSVSGSVLSSISGVDPSMLCSFYDDTASLSATMDQAAPSHIVENPSRQPYEHQTQESLREREEARRSHYRTTTVSLGTSSRPGLQRSKTDTGLRPSTNSSTDSRGSASHIPRRSSPLKRLNTELNSIPELSKNRPRTRLIIDESGRARTETDPAPEHQREGRQDPRSQYPGLWSDDESGSDDDRPVISRPNSFVFDPPIRLPSKHGRLDSIGRSGSFKKARPSSMISLDGSLFDSEHGYGMEFRRFSNASFSSNKEGSSNPLDMAGDAQNALKKVVEGRMRRQERTVSSPLKSHSQRWSQAPADISRPQSGHSMNFAFSDGFNASPGRMADVTELDTPSTNRSSLLTGSTRCVCNSTDGDGQLMIQCESCNKWLHTQCVGLNHKNLPSVYLCVFCTSTPARGGRIRENMRPVTTYASPLTHKSTYRR